MNNYRTKDGQDLKPSHRVNAVRDGTSTYKLEFRDLIGEEDDGVYEITATNDEGNYLCSMYGNPDSTLGLFFNLFKYFLASLPLPLPLQ